MVVGRRGARPLGPPPARVPHARPVHPGRRAHRRDPPAHDLRGARRARAVPGVARRRARPRHLGEPVGSEPLRHATSSRTSARRSTTAGVPPSALTLELTESTVMGESHRSMAVLDGLQALGVRLSVDDFGTGYSSLTHLRSLPVTELKIDKSFVMTMTVNDQDAVIVRTLVELGRSLGLRTVAEGVESAGRPGAAPRATAARRRRATCSAGRSRPSSSSPWLARQHVRRIDLGRPGRAVPPRAAPRGRRRRPRLSRSTSDERPGVAAAGLVDREAPGSHERPGAGPHGVALERVEQRGERVRAARRRPARRRPSRIGSGTGSPPNSQITVRSLNSWWNIRPWSMPRIRPSSPSRQWPLLRSVLLPTRSKAHIARSWSWFASSS